MTTATLGPTEGDASSAVHQVRLPPLTSPELTHERSAPSIATKLTPTLPLSMSLPAGISDAYYCTECTRLEKDRDGCPKIVNLGASRTDLFYERK